LKFNSIHRGNEQSPFQITWLKETIATIEFYKYCKNFSQNCLTIYELSMDANLGNINIRKYENGASMVVRTVQDKINDAINEIEIILPKLNKIGFIRMFFLYSKGYFDYFLNEKETINEK